MGQSYFIATSEDAGALANFLATEDGAHLMVTDSTAVIVASCHPPLKCAGCGDEGCIGCGWAAHIKVSANGELTTLCPECQLCKRC